MTSSWPSPVRFHTTACARVASEAAAGCRRSRSPVASPRGASPAPGSSRAYRRRGCRRRRSAALAARPRANGIGANPRVEGLVEPVERIEEVELVDGDPARVGEGRGAAVAARVRGQDEAPRASRSRRAAPRAQPALRRRTRAARRAPRARRCRRRLSYAPAAAPGARAGSRSCPKSIELGREPMCRTQGAVRDARRVLVREDGLDAVVKTVQVDHDVDRVADAQARRQVGKRVRRLTLAAPRRAVLEAERHLRRAREHADRSVALAAAAGGPRRGVPATGGERDGEEEAGRTHPCPRGASTSHASAP